MPTTTPTHWRPEVVWVPMGGLLGALAGALTGVALLLATTLVERAEAGGYNESLGMTIMFTVMVGAWFGGIAGLVVGLVVGAELMFLVGSHLPRAVARRRAHRWGSVLPPVTMLAMVAVPDALDGGFGVSLPSGHELWWLSTLAGGSLLGGPFARWAAGFRPPSPPVS